MKILVFMGIIGSLMGFKQAAVRHIKGRVDAWDDRLPIAGALIMVKGTNISVKADRYGEYVINVPDGCDRLLFSAVEFVTLEVPVGKKNKIKVELKMTLK